MFSRCHGFWDHVTVLLCKCALHSLNISWQKWLPVWFKDSCHAENTPNCAGDIRECFLQGSLLYVSCFPRVREWFCRRKKHSWVVLQTQEALVSGFADAFFWYNLRSHYSNATHHSFPLFNCLFTYFPCSAGLFLTQRTVPLQQCHSSFISFV